MKPRRKNKKFVGMIFFVIIAALPLILLLFLFSRPTFNVTEIMLIIDKMEAKKVDFQFLNIKPKINIFKVNLTSATKELKSKHLEYEKAYIIRDFPNRLKVYVELRKPVAQVKFGNYYLVDKEGIIISDAFMQKRPQMVEILGVNLGQGPFKAGAKPSSVGLQNALFLLKKLEESALSQKFKIDKIDVASYNNLSFFIDDIQVKLGPQDIQNKLKSLERFLAKGNLDLKKVKYFDLRFEDVVIGPK